MESREIFFLTQEQFIGYDIDKSIKEFSNILSSKFYYSYFFPNIYIDLLFRVYKPTIEKYRKGFIDTDSFLGELVYIMGLEKSDIDDVKKAWNKMCEISPEKKEEILFAAKNYRDILVVSYSNDLHREYISNQLNELFLENSIPQYEWNKHIYIYSPRTPIASSNEVLVCEAIAKLDLHRAENNVVIYSLNNEINNNSCKDLQVDIRPYDYEDFLCGLASRNYES